MLSSLAFAAKDDKKKDDSLITLDVGNVIVMRGTVNDATVGNVVRQLLLTDQDDVYLYITSPGGSIMSGDRLVEFLKKTDKNVTCIADYAASMAFTILQHCHKRFIMGDSLMMQHEAWLMAYGEYPNFLSWVKLISTVIDKVENSTATRMHMPMAEYKKKIANDWWMYGKQGLKQKAADKLVRVICSKKLTKKIRKQTVRGWWQNSTLTWSGCPLIAHPLTINGDEFIPHAKPKDSEEELSAVDMLIKNNWTPTVIRNVNVQRYQTDSVPKRK